MTAVWRCAKCARTQGEDIEQPCACGSTVWVSSSYTAEAHPLAMPAPRVDPSHFNTCAGQVWPIVPPEEDETEDESMWGSRCSPECGWCGRCS